LRAKKYQEPKAAGKKKWKPKRKTLLPNTKTGTGHVPYQALKAKRTRNQNVNQKQEMPD
jgi:hypothetical protein